MCPSRRRPSNRRLKRGRCGWCFARKKSKLPCADRLRGYAAKLGVARSAAAGPARQFGLAARDALGPDSENRGPVRRPSVAGSGVAKGQAAAVRPAPIDRSDRPVRQREVAMEFGALCGASEPHRHQAGSRAKRSSGAISKPRKSCCDLSANICRSPAEPADASSAQRLPAGRRRNEIVRSQSDASRTVGILQNLNGRSASVLSRKFVTQFLASGSL
jgi:hypothetical protein